MYYSKRTKLVTKQASSLAWKYVQVTEVDAVLLEESGEGWKAGEDGQGGAQQLYNLHWSTTACKPQQEC